MNTFYLCMCYFCLIKFSTLLRCSIHIWKCVIINKFFMQTLNELINLTVPEKIRLTKELDLEESVCMFQFFAIV